MDTNHLERALRLIPMGRRNWLFTWTELGAKQVGIIQSLLTTCRLHEISPYDYLVDVLQRIDGHPASRVSELTPRLWKLRFATNPLRSDLHACADEGRETPLLEPSFSASVSSENVKTAIPAQVDHFYRGDVVDTNSALSNSQ